MTDSRPAGAANGDALGVVDPLRIPGAAAALRIWAGLPYLARAFVVLAAVDVLVRALGLFGTNLYLDLGSPLTWFSAFFPHDALILLPAIVILRRPNAIESTPVVVRGAILVALVEVLNPPLRGLVSGNPADPFAGPTIISILGILLTAAGWYSLASGLRVMNPVKVEESIAGLANLVGGTIALGAVVDFVLVLVRPGPDFGDATWTSLMQLNSAMLVVQWLALAYLARVVVLGTRDPTRPVAATYLATGALAGYAIGFLLFVMAIGTGPIWTVIAFLSGPVAMTAFLAAFGLGLADPSVTIEPAVQTDQSASS